MKAMIKRSCRIPSGRHCLSAQLRGDTDSKRVKDVTLLERRQSTADSLMQYTVGVERLVRQTVVRKRRCSSLAGSLARVKCQSVY